MLTAASANDFLVLHGYVCICYNNSSENCKRCCSSPTGVLCMTKLYFFSLDQRHKNYARTAVAGQLSPRYSILTVFKT